MLSKKKKVFILIGMVALLVVTGCLNIFLNKNSDPLDPIGGSLNNASFFDTFRADRTSTREQTVLYLDAIIENPSSTAEAKADAEASKKTLTDNMEMELVIEGLIKALGFADAVVTNSTENINIIVKSTELNDTQVAQILDIIVTETDKAATNVRIIPVE